MTPLFGRITDGRPSIYGERAGKPGGVGDALVSPFHTYFWDFLCDKSAAFVCDYDCTIATRTYKDTLYFKGMRIHKANPQSLTNVVASDDGIEVSLLRNLQSTRINSCKNIILDSGGQFPVFVINVDVERYTVTRSLYGQKRLAFVNTKDWHSLIPSENNPIVSQSYYCCIFRWPFFRSLPTKGQLYTLQLRSICSMLGLSLRGRYELRRQSDFLRCRCGA